MRPSACTSTPTARLAGTHFKATYRITDRTTRQPFRLSPLSYPYSSRFFPPPREYPHPTPPFQIGVPLIVNPRTIFFPRFSYYTCSVSVGMLYIGDHDVGPTPSVQVKGQVVSVGRWIGHSIPIQAPPPQSSAITSSYSPPALPRCMNHTGPRPVL